MSNSSSDTLLIVLGLFSFVAITLFWFTWFVYPDFIQSRSPSDPQFDMYVNFEQSFIVADSWFALISLVGAVGVWRGRSWGYLFLLLAGSSAIFLGLMDLTYDLQNSMFSPFSFEAIIELIIIALLLTLGPLIIMKTWRTLNARADGCHNYWNHSKHY